jgi:hypothetical protein
MNVVEALEEIAEVSEEKVLVAKRPLTGGAPAMFVDLTEDYGVPQHVKDAGYEYPLEREDILQLLEFLKKKG